MSQYQVCSSSLGRGKYHRVCVNQNMGQYQVCSSNLAVGKYHRKGSSQPSGQNHG